jgi:hypothetical protein
LVDGLRWIGRRCNGSSSAWPHGRSLESSFIAAIGSSAIAGWINSLSHDDRRVLDGRQSWSAKSVLCVLGNRVYLGRMGAVADAHDAIVDEELFAKARAAVDSRRTREPGGRPTERVTPSCCASSSGACTATGS